jgi:hypothetical protein
MKRKRSIGGPSRLTHCSHRTCKPALEPLEPRHQPSFIGPIALPSANTTFALVSADFNHDGHLDLVSVNPPISPGPSDLYGSTCSISVYLGRGDGTFDQVAPVNVPGSYFNIGSMVVGDFNGDGTMDFAVSFGGFENGGSLQGAGIDLFLSKGDGTFQPVIRYDTGISFGPMAAISLPGQTSPVLVATGNNAVISLRYANGALTPFALAGLHGSGLALAVGDFNNDGNADLAVSYAANSGNPNEPNGIQVLFGDGQGNFRAGPIFEAPVGAHYVSLAVADFYGIGELDLAAAQSGPGTLDTISILRPNLDGTFDLARSVPIGLPISSVVAADFNQDGHMDLAVNSGNSRPVLPLHPGIIVSAVTPGATSILLGDGQGNFDPPVRYTTGAAPTGLAAGDFNSDGAPDLAVANPSDTHISLLLSSTLHLQSGAHIVVTGADAGTDPLVNVYDAQTHQELASFEAYDYRFKGGVRVAVGDINGDGVRDIITAPGPGGGPDVRIFDGATGQLVDEFMAYDPGFAGGVNLAIGDFNGDHVPDIVTGADAGGGPHVKVFDGKTLGHAVPSILASFYAFDPGFAGGVRVAVGDTNGDGVPDLITAPGAGGGPDVRVWDGARLDLAGSPAGLLREFMAYDPRFSGGVYVTSGDVFGNGVDYVVTGAGSGGSPDVKVFGNTLSWDFLAYSAGFAGGVRVGIAPNPGNPGHIAIITGAGPGGGPEVVLFDPSGQFRLADFYAYASDFAGGTFVAGG